MPNNASNYLETQLVGHLFRTGSFTKPAALHVALFTTLPAEDGTGGVEVSGGSYARVQRNPSDANWSAATDVGGLMETSNVAALDFGTASANWGTIVGFGIYDASSAGNLLVYGSLTASKTVNSGDGFQIPAGQLKVQIG